jgi:TonB-linked SusC/RagA family outer membrane protein
MLLWGAVGLLFASSATEAAAQRTGIVRGVVRTEGTGRPIENAQVAVLATRIGALTDRDGQYEIANVPEGSVRLQIRAIGYATQTVTVAVLLTQPATQDFLLKGSVIALDEIVVTGTGAAVEKKQLGNTIATVDLAQLANAPVQSFSEVLAAREPSVVVQASSGLAGAGARIRIRGTSSLSMSNEPVVYLDGIRIDNAGDMDGIFAEAAAPSKLDDINPESIERIEVLKGAAAATLYGSEASAGVIQIFTKRGSQGPARFSVRVEQGVSTYPDVFKPNAGFARDAAQAATINDLYGLSLQPYEVFERTFVRDMLETGRQQSYSVSVTGGGQDILYYVAGRVINDDGPIGGQELGPARDLDRKIQGNFNISIFPRERLSFRIGGLFTDLRHQLPENGNNIFGVMPLAMFGKPELASCDDIDGDGKQDIDRTRMVGNTTPVCSVSGNPTGQIAFQTVRESMQQVTAQDAEHFNGNIGITYQAASSFTIEAKFGIDVTNGRSFYFAPFGYDVDKFTGNNVDGFRDIGSRNHRELTLDVKGIWSTRFGGNLSSTLTAGIQGYIAKNRMSGGSGSVFPGPGLEVAGAAANQSLSESSLETVNTGLFAQEQFGFNDFVYLTLGGRWDKASAFGEETGGQFYPKAGVSIVPSDMSGWSSSVLSTVRVRAAVGKSGLQPGAFAKFTTFGPGPTSEGPGLEPGNLGNQDLRPERATEWEVGAEFGLFDDRAAVDVTYWRRVTRDALIARQFPVTGGFTESQLVNIGELEGKGVEVKLDWLAMNRENVSIGVFINGSYLKEKINSMGAAPPIKVGGSYPRYRNFLKEGFAPGTYFGAQLIDFTPGVNVPYDTNGDGQPDTEAEFRAFLGGNASIGLSDAEMSPLIRDDDGDGDLLDHFLGKPTPDWQGSWGANVTLWRNFQINTVFEFKTGNYSVTNLTDAFRQSNPSIGRNFKQAAEVEATLLNPATQGDVDARFDAAMQWALELKALAPLSGLNTIENARFVRWRELSLAYRVPSSFLSRFGLDDLTISLSGRNLFKWDGYTGIDQEMNALSRCGGNGAADRDCNFLDGVDAFGLPLPRRYTLAVQLGF